MAEPTSKFTIQGLIKRVARESGIAYYGSSGNERAMIPIDAHDLDLCKEIVEDGIKMFMMDAPVKGWRWRRRILPITFASTRITGTADAGTNATHLIDLTLATTYTTTDELLNYYAYILTGTGAGSYAKITAYNKTTGDCTVADWLDANGNAGGADPTTGSTFAITDVETIGGDLARYPLPENFGGSADGQIQYAKDTSHSSIIQWASESLIRQRRAITVVTGYPRMAAIRPFEPVNSAPSAKRRFELIVDPQPTAADTVEFPYSLHFDNLQIEAGDASSVDGTTGLLDTALDGLYADDYFNGWIIKITGGTGKGSYAPVSDYVGTTAKFIVADWLDINGDAGGTDPAANSVYIVEPVNNLHPAGFRFDNVILSACLAIAEERIDDINNNYMQKYLKKDLPKAYEEDRRSAPRRLGNFRHGQEFVRERMYTDIVYE